MRPPSVKSRFWEFAEHSHPYTAPFGNGFGAAMSSSPGERLWNGDADVATLYLRG